MTLTPPGVASRLASLFSAVTSAMQPARLPLALLCVLLLAALTPVVDLAAGKGYGARGFAGGAMTESERELAYQRARSAASRIATVEVQSLEQDGRDAGEDLAPPRRLSLGELEGAVRTALSARLAERAESEAGLDATEARRLRQRAADVIKTIRDASPRGVATVFLESERSAVRQTVTGLFRLDPEMFLAGILGAVFSVPAAAVREAPVVFPLALLVLACAVTVLAGASCRMAAVHAGRDARLTMLEGSGFARARVLNLVSLPVLPTILFAALALVVVVFALLLRVPVLNVLSGVLFVVPLVVALLGAILALVVILGYPLMPAAIAVEDCDAGDAITRAAALVLSRPLLWIVALSTAIAALSVGGFVVQGVLLVASGAVDAILVALGGAVGDAIASGDESQVRALVGPDRLVGATLWFWTGLLDAMLAAYLFTLACDLSTRCYLLVRERIDGESPSTIAGYGIR